MLERMTWQDVEKAIEEGYDSIIVPVGSVEQHGPHLPLGTDKFIGELLAIGVAEGLGKTLVTPTICPGFSVHHMSFPGTLTVSNSTLMLLLSDVCSSLDRHGFRNIILLPSHGGNFAPVNTVVQEIAPDLNANLIAVADLMELIKLMKEAAAEKGVPPEAVGGHAGAGETSLMEFYKPLLVRKEKIEPGYIGPFTNKYVRQGFQAVTPKGVLGDPGKASAEVGEHIMRNIVDAYVSKIKQELDI